MKQFQSLTAFVILCAALAAALPAAHAQPQCGYADQLEFPVDRSVYQLMQGFGVPNFRFRGWYHTGEDWAAGRGQTLGQPVRAIAAGRVTLSSPIVWGRDGGVIIIEHTFPDGTILYSQYGHLIESGDVSFPRPFTCVQLGQAIGVIGEARPAPHLHFEMRINNFDLAGPGYTETHPFDLGYRRPSKLIANWQTWLGDVHLWHQDLQDEAGPQTPPIVLSDNSLVYLDGFRVERVTPDGRVLWRYTLDQSAAALHPAALDGVLVLYRSGQIDRLDAGGSRVETWAAGAVFDGAAIPLGERWLLPTDNNSLTALDADLRTVLWRVENAGPVRQWASSGGLMALSLDESLVILDGQGTVIQRQPTTQPTALAVDADGRLLAYANAALWTLDLPYGTETAGKASPGTLLVLPDGQAFVFDAGIFTAFDAARQIRWQYAVPTISGEIQLTADETVIVLTSTHGQIAAVRQGDGALCGSVSIFGDDRARAWSQRGADGVLRAAIADQIIGLDWQRLLGPCTVG